MHHSRLIAGLLTACLTSLEVMEVPLALAEGTIADILSSRSEYAAASPSSSPLIFRYNVSESSFREARAAIASSQRTRNEPNNKVKTVRKTNISAKKYSSRYKYSKKRRTYARYAKKKSPSKKTSRTPAFASSSTPKNRVSKTYSGRYRANKSNKKYSRYHGKRYRGKHRYARRGRYRSKSSSVQYARVSDAVRSVRGGLAQNWHETLKDVELMPGVRYKHYFISTGNKHSVHVLEVDRTKPEVGIALFKGQNLYNGLERLSDIATRTDSSASDMLQGMINASFWKSAANTPLGPTIINGEVLEMGQYKEWSACFFDRQNRMYIERFSMSGMAKLKSITLDIDKVNRRTSKDGVVLYNHFAGKSVPMQAPLQIDMIEGDRQANPDELSDTKTSKTEFNRIVQEQQRSAQLEKSLRKAVLLYAGQPAVNEDVACRVIDVDTGAVNIPQNGIVLSFGDNIEQDDIPKPGDKVMIQFKTNLFSSVPFVQAVAGTPRLVNRGIARHEAEFEGARSERFMSQKLPRTAVGMDATGTMLYFVAVEGTSAENNTTGMTIQQLAEGMKQLGAYHAMSLDGGQSTAMVVRGSGLTENIGNQRKVSVALGIVRQSPSDRSSQPRRKLITKPNSGAKPDAKDSIPQTQPSEPSAPEKSNGIGSGVADGSPNGKD